MNERRYKAVAAGAITALTLILALFVNAAPASAVGGNCSATLQKDTGTIPDSFRSGAMCSSLQADSRARAKLIRNGGPDYSGSWFTALNTYRYTGWYNCYAGCTAGYEIGPV